MGFTPPFLIELETRLFTASAALPVSPRLPAGSTTLTAVLSAMSPSALVASPPVTRAPTTLPTALSIPVPILSAAFTPTPASSNFSPIVSPIFKLPAAELAREPMPPDAIPLTTSCPEIPALTPPTIAPVAALVSALSSPGIPVGARVPTAPLTIGVRPTPAAPVSPDVRDCFKLPPIAPVCNALIAPVPIA